MRWRPPLGWDKAQLEAGPIDVGDLEVGGLGEAEPAAEDGHEKDTGERIASGADADEALNLLGGEDTRRLDATWRALDPLQEWFDVASEQAAVEGAQGIDGEVDRGSRELALRDEVE